MKKEVQHSSEVKMTLEDIRNNDKLESMLSKITILIDMLKVTFLFKRLDEDFLCQ